eukprot:126572_1
MSDTKDGSQLSIATEQRKKVVKIVFSRFRKIVFSQNSIMVGLLFYDLRFMYVVYRYHWLNRNEIGHDNTVYPPAIIERDTYLIPNIHSKYLFVSHILFGNISLLSSIHNIWNLVRESNINRHKTVGKMYLLSVLLSFLPTLKMSFDFPHTSYKILINTPIIGLDIMWFLSSFLSYYYMGNFGGYKSISKHQQWSVRSAAYGHTVPLISRIVHEIIVYPIMGCPHYKTDIGSKKLSNLGTISVPITFAIIMPICEILTYYQLPKKLRKTYSILGLY